MPVHQMKKMIMKQTITSDNISGMFSNIERSPTIAIDYDDTLSLKPDMWREIIPLFKKFGFKVYIVTYRYSNGIGNTYWGFAADNSDMDWAIELCDGVVFTGLKSKRLFCQQNNIYPDIWIDDTPEAIVFNNCHDRQLEWLVKHINLHGMSNVRVERDVISTPN